LEKQGLDKMTDSSNSTFNQYKKRGESDFAIGYCNGDNSPSDSKQRVKIIEEFVQSSDAFSFNLYKI
jgi:hypothetical protein